MGMPIEVCTGSLCLQLWAQAKYLPDTEVVGHASEAQKYVHAGMGKR